MTVAIPLRSALAAGALAFTLAVTGCGAQQGDYDSDIADHLQGEVLEVSQLSAAADFAGAMLTLTELEAGLKDARARGLLTEERYESILAATALVRADLQAALDAQAPPPTAPEANTGGAGGNEGTGNQGNGNGNNGKKDKKDKKGKDD
jgi:hypothetical protein